MPNAIEKTLSDIAFLEDWEDKYRYIIEMGRALEALRDDERISRNKVQGCVSQVWLVSEEIAGADGKTRLNFRGASDALIVSGLIALLLQIYSGREPQKILKTDALAILSDLELQEHLTPSRSNGLSSMVSRIQSLARESLAASEGVAAGAGA